MELKNGASVKTPDILIVKNKERKCIVYDTENAQKRIPISVNLADYHNRFYTCETVNLPQFVIDFLSRKTTNIVEDGIPDAQGQHTSVIKNTRQYIVQVLD